jgi:hypothetical protein
MQTQIHCSNLGYYDTDLLSNVTSIVSNNTTEIDIVIPNISNIDTTIKTNFLRGAIEKFPIIQTTLDIQKYNLGKNCYIKTQRIMNNNIYFCQMFCDKNSRNRNINYIHLVNCMVDIRNFCLEIKRKTEKQIEIHCPKFGTGISGGRWSTISDLMTDCWYGIPTFIYTKSHY